MVVSMGAISLEAVGAAGVLALIRVSVMVALSPFFNSRAFAARTKALLSAALCWLMVPILAGIAGASQAPIRLSVSGALGEAAVGAIYGLTLSLFSEMLLLAGQIVGLQFSFSLVNLLDPASEIQTPLMGDLFQMFGTLVLITAGLDRIVIASLVRSFRLVPPGSFPLKSISVVSETLVPAFSGSFLAALELAAPVLAATLLVEVSVALLGRLSPQLPVISLTVPLKTMAGFVVLIGSLAVWPRFMEARFGHWLDIAECLIVRGGRS